MKNVLIKVSGDLFGNPNFFRWLLTFGPGSRLVICVGGGTQIKEEFERRGWKGNNFRRLGRETTPEQAKVAKGILCDNQLRLIEDLREHEITADVVIPMLECAGVESHINGDQFIRTFYHGFDKLWVVTTPEREKDKAKLFVGLPKVRVTSFA